MDGRRTGLILGIAIFWLLCVGLTAVISVPLAWIYSEPYGETFRGGAVMLTVVYVLYVGVYVIVKRRKLHRGKVEDPKQAD